MNRWREVARAGHEGNAPLARAALHDTDPVVRELAIGALERLGELTIDDVRACLGDDTPGVRRRAVTVVATFDLDARTADEFLVATLHDPDNAVVETAAWVAGERERVADEVLTRVIELATSSDDPLIREAAVAALGAIGDERGLPAILHGCSDKPAIRRRAVLALAPFDAPEAIEAMRTGLNDRDWQVRQSAEDVLRATGIDDLEGHVDDHADNELLDDD